MWLYGAAPNAPMKGEVRETPPRKVCGEKERGDLTWGGWAPRPGQLCSLGGQAVFPAWPLYTWGWLHPLHSPPCDCGSMGEPARLLETDREAACPAGPCVCTPSAASLKRTVCFKLLLLFFTPIAKQIVSFFISRTGWEKNPGPYKASALSLGHILTH